jgi:hypothetical protein
VGCVDQRAKKLNRQTPTSGDSLSALLSDGLILWRLSTPERRDLWCFIFERNEGFYLVVDDDPNGTDPYQVHEQHSDIVSVAKRADALRAFLVKCGWEDVDVE